MNIKISKKIISLLSFVFCGLLLFGQDPITIYRDSYLETNAACPKTEYQYWVDTKPNYGNYEWKITGGSFKHFGQNVKEINLTNVSSVIVIWDNVMSSGGNAPKGTITLNVYDKDQASSVVGNDKLYQDIKSLKDMIPPSLSSSATSSRLNFGEQEVRVFLIGAFNFPGIMSNGFPIPVTQYEWQIPAGWRAKTGSITPSGTYMTSNSEIILITDASTEGQVQVRGVNDCAGSGDYSQYSWPITFTRDAGIEFLEYPETIPIGEINTYKFSVLLLTGVSFEWQAPSGWSINGGGNTYIGGNVIQITTSECPTNEKVRIRMVQGNDYSSWVEFPMTVALPSINVPNDDIIQYQSATFSLDMPDENIASVEWLVNGNLAGVTTNTSSLSFIINEWGTINISANLILKSCSAVSIPELEIEVAKAPAPAISGPSTVCNEGTYTIENFNSLPQGATVEWGVNNNNLTLVSGQGFTSAVFMKNGEGNSRVQANIHFGSNTLTLSSRAVSTEIQVSILGSTTMVGCNSKRMWDCSLNCPIDIEGINITWSLESKEQRFFGSGYDFTIITSCNSKTSDVLRQPIDAPHAIYTLLVEVVFPDGQVYSAPAEFIQVFGNIEVLGPKD